MSAIQELQTRLQGTNALIARYRDALVLPETTEREASVLRVNMRSLQNLAKRLGEQFLEHAAMEHLEVYEYRLLTEEKAPSLGGVGEAWSKLQALYAAIYKSLTNKAVAAVVQAPQLGFAYAFPGSVGVVVTLPAKPEGEILLTKSPVNEASEIVFDMIEGIGVQGIAQRLGPAPIQAMNEWLEVHVSNGYGLEIAWKADRETKRKVEKAPAEIVTLQGSVQDTKTRQSVTLTGWLNKVDDKDKTFRIKADNGDEIEGKYSESVIQAEHTASIPARYTATILTVTEMIQSGGKKPKPEIILERLEPL